MTRYEEIMDRVVVTDGMRDRILRNIRQQQRHTHNMRSATTWLPILAAAAVMLVVCGVAYSNFGARNQTTTELAMDAPESKVTPEPIGTTENDEEMAVASAIYAPEEFDSAAELSAYVGFEVKDLTNVPFAIASVEYYAIDADFAEVDYRSMGDVTSLCYRKSVGTEDNSGDYNTYDVNETEEIAGCTVALKGDSERYYLATWNDGTHAYSVGLSDGCTRDELVSVVTEIME